MDEADQEAVLESGKQEETEDDVEEGMTAKQLSQPQAPSRRLVEQHELTHLPYRSWCVHCIEEPEVLQWHIEKGKKRR